ncbi:nuclear transport factor 2 family protein [Mycolicibacterium tusciae]|uniref:nuclear transport factor 2 family protein n=1 Tax=Mycolicibacterium tusciae TaxID=75922 RepID=UPI00024A1ED5|nr:nuclear transport factor 2 family protein [Mycolicibacterium tusciae]
MTPTRTEDLVEIQQLLAKYAVTITQGDVEGLVTVFTPDGTYSAFGSTYTLARFPELVAAAPSGLFMTGTSLVDLVEGADTATGTQPLCFIEHSKHDMRIGYYNDTYVRTDDGWRLKTRAMTFIRRSGEHDSGRPHAIGRPEADVPAGAPPEPDVAAGAAPEPE